ncbi:MAG TPA: acetyl-CoA carboxylase biotin carboxylase subunit, partial [candidate division Zixibacteria bacterium]|nr:acetyl-CoA carboxylase biotin carboxylase subunit [candidate division Zixibacteria bacterium]
STGKVVHYSEPSGPGIRIDSGIRRGGEVTINYDPIMAKLIVHAPDRNLAIRKMIDALNQYKILGVKTSKRFMIDVLVHPEFAAGRTYTNFIEKHMGERDVTHAEFQGMALAAAAASQSNSGAGQDAAASTGRAVRTTPWQTLGSVQIGDAIHE